MSTERGKVREDLLQLNQVSSTSSPRPESPGPEVVDSEWVKRNLGLTSELEFPCQVCGSMVPVYNTIQLPSILFNIALMDEDLYPCLCQYTEHLQFAGFVPYMLTEYINNEHKKQRVCRRFRPENLCEYFIQLILRTQPKFTCYFTHL